MKKMQLTNVQGKDYTLTTEHSASSYGRPVLIAPDGTAFGPSDCMGDSTAATVIGHWFAWARDMLSVEEQEFIAKFAM